MLAIMKRLIISIRLFRIPRTCRCLVLSCLPDKTAYLQEQGHEILRDPFYSGLGDPINQAHFMQILKDIKIVRVNDVPFTDAELAAKIFPNGEFTPDDKGTIH